MRKVKTPKPKKRTATVRGAQYEYTVIFEPAEEGGYIVTVPALPGLHTEGDTFEEARAMAEDAIRCYIEGCILDGFGGGQSEIHLTAVRRSTRS
jgi:predicted RNase H-like HicB family nuclease